MSSSPDTIVWVKPNHMPKTEHAIAKARAEGKVEIVHKDTSASSYRSALNKKLDSDDVTGVTLPSIPLEFRLALSKARQEKGWSQKDLAQKINVKPTVINEYESGKAIPHPQIVAQLNRILGVKLPKITKPKQPKSTD